MYIPEGFGTVFPYLLVDRADEFARFLRVVFDADELGRTELPDGRVANVRIRIGTSSFMVSEVDGESLKAMPAALERR
jgi:PhnB protein